MFVSIQGDLNKSLYIKTYSIYIGCTFPEMEDVGVLDRLNCRVLYSSSAFSRALLDRPKIVIVNCFQEQEKNNAIIQEVVSKSPDSKIIVIGRTVDEFKRILSQEISTFLSSDVSFEGLKIAIDQLSFDYQYGEGFEDEEIVLGDNSAANQTIWVMLIVVIGFLIGLIYYLI